MGRCSWDLCAFLGMFVTGGPDWGFRLRKNLALSKAVKVGDLQGGSEQPIPRGVQAETLHNISLAMWWGGVSCSMVHCQGGPPSCCQ